MYAKPQFCKSPVVSNIFLPQPGQSVLIADLVGRSENGVFGSNSRYFRDANCRIFMDYSAWLEALGSWVGWPESPQPATVPMRKTANNTDIAIFNRKDLNMF